MLKIKALHKAVLWTALGALCAVPSAVGQTQVSMTLTGAGSNGAYGGVYIGPYVATVNGVTGVQVICDDYVAHTTLGESWTADETSLVPLDSSTAKFGSVTDAQAKYEQIAYLSLQLFDTTDTTTAIALQYAIWGIFDTSLTTTTAYTNSGASGALSGVPSTGDLALMDFSGISILTPLDKTTGPQEFIVKTPEPTLSSILLVDLSAVGALILFFRRRRIHVSQA